MIRKIYKNGIFFDLVAVYDELVENGWYKNSEIETQDWIIDNAKKNWISLDVGAHIGYYSMLLSLCCPDGHVYAIEIAKETIDMMIKNIGYNTVNNAYNLSNISIHNTGIGHEVVDNHFETVWISGKRNFGMTSACFNFTTIDAFCVDNNINKLDFIKTDIDGWDYDALVGAREVMTSLRPTIVIEANYALAWRKHTIEDVIKLTNKMNYSTIWLDKACPGNLLLIPNGD